MDVMSRVDEGLSVLGEQVARRLSRRSFLWKGLSGMTVAAAAVASGEISRVTDVAAIDCSCMYGLGHCGCDGSCTSCEAFGWTTCTPNNDCDNGNLCFWSSGGWVAGNGACTGFGSCGNGFRECIDCLGGSCGPYCTGLTRVFCEGCCSPADVRAEVLRLVAERKGAA
jgi:hypothetical protein